MISVNSLILSFNLFKTGQVAVKLMRGQGVEDIRSDDEDEDPKLLGDWEIICYFNEWCMMNHLSWFSDGNHSSCKWFWYDWVLNHIFFTKLGLSMVQRKSCDSDHLCMFLEDTVHIKILRFFFEITSLTSPTSHSWRPSHLQEEELRSSVSEYGNTSICSALWKAFFCEDLMAQQKCVSRVWKFTSKGWTKFEMHGFPKRSGAFESVEDEQWSTNTALPILQPLQLLPERWNTWTIAWTAGRMFFSLLCALHIHRLAGLPRDWGRWDHGIIGSFQANWKLHLKEHTYCMCICWNSKIHTAQQSFRSQEHLPDHRKQANHTWDHTSHILLYTYVNIYIYIS